MVSRQWIMGIFKDPQKFLQALRVLKTEKIPVEDAYTPYPFHELDDLLIERRSRLAIVTFVAGFFGLVFALFFQFWTSAVDWPVNVGGKPLNSTLAYIPVTFEVTILIGALATVLAFFIKSRLFFGKKACVFHLSATDDQFVIVIENKASLSENKTCELLVREGGVVEKKSVIS